MKDSELYWLSNNRSILSKYHEYEYNTGIFYYPTIILNIIEISHETVTSAFHSIVSRGPLHLAIIVVEYSNNYIDPLHI